MANRLWVPFGKDRVAVSDILDYTRYSVAEQELRLNTGSDDSIVALAPAPTGQLVVFKDQSVHMLTNVFSDLSTLASNVVTEERGLAGPEAWDLVGADMWFLSPGAEGGIYTISQALEGRLQANANALTDPITPLLRRINWAAASGALLRCFGSKVYIAVPLDGASRNDVLIVYDLNTAKWAGYWNFAGMDVRGIFATDVGTRRRLYLVNGGSGTVTRSEQGVLAVFTDGFMDQWLGNLRDIRTELLTRGYMGGLPGWKQFSEVEAEVETWRPTWSLTARSAGQGQEIALITNQTASNVAYQTWGTANYDPTNAHDDHAAPYREDYSLSLADEAQVDLGVHGVDPEILARSVHQRRPRQKGRYVQLFFANTQGRMVIHRAGVRGRQTDGGVFRKA
jgi:hypothetical protein